MKIVYVILIAMAALQGCVKVIPPMTDTSDAAKIIYTRMALNLGELQALRMFDNPRFEMTERSGRLIEHEIDGVRVIDSVMQLINDSDPIDLWPLILVVNG